MSETQEQQTANNIEHKKSQQKPGSIEVEPWFLKYKGVSWDICGECKVPISPLVSNHHKCGDMD